MQPQLNSFKASDGTSLFYRVWQPNQTTDCDIFIIHGLLEHGGRYEHLPDAFLNLGLTARIFLMDYRGHGRSNGRRGDCQDFDELVSDHYEFLNKILLPENEKLSGDEKRPLIMIGHSTGGLIAHMLLSGFYPPYHFNKCDGAILSAPAYEVSAKVPRWKTLLSEVLAKSPLAGLSVPAALDPELLTKDPIMVEKTRKDPLLVPTLTPRFWILYTEAMASLKETPGEVSCPLLMGLAGDDQVVNTDTSLRVFKETKAPQKDKIVYPGFSHEIFNEVDRNKVFSDCVFWIKQNVL